MANRFDGIINQNSSSSSDLPGVNRFTNVVQESSGKNRFSGVVEKDQSIIARAGKKTLKLIGGAFGYIGDKLSVGQYATTGVIEKGLEETGILKDTDISGTGIKEGVTKKKSNIEVLRRIGEENTTPDSVAGTLFSNYTPSQNVFGNFIRETPVTAVGILGDIILDPLSLIGKLGKVAKYTGKAGEAIDAGFDVMKARIPAVQKAADMLGRAFITRFGQRAEFANLDKNRMIAESLAQEQVHKLVSPIIESPKVIQQRIAQVVKGGITSREDIRALADPIREEFDRVGQSISELNPALLNPDTFQANKGTYFPRMYTNYEFPKNEDEIVNQFFSTRNINTPKTRFKTRLDDIDFAEGYLLSQGQDNAIIREYLSLSAREVKGLSQLKDIPGLGRNGSLDLNKVGIKTLEDLANPEKTGGFVGDEFDRFLNIRRYLGERAENVVNSAEELISRNRGTVSKFANEKGGRLGEIEKEIKRIAQEARDNLGEIKEAGLPALKGLTQLNIAEKRQTFFSEVSKLASDEPKPGWIQVADDKSLGALSGKYLPAAEYRAITEIKRIPTKAEEIYSNALSLWKTFKTAYNPATISRNDLTNFFVLNPLGGVGPHRLDIYSTTINDLMSKGHYYQLARQHGLEISTQQAAELKSQASRFYQDNDGLVKKIFGKFSNFHDTVKNFYGSQDKFFKLANFIKGVAEDGLTPAEAMNRANFYLVDYSEVPELVNWLRKSPIGVPFISFTYGVSKPLAKTLLERPDKLSAYYKILKGIQEMNPLGETPQEIESERGVLPDWISDGTFLRLPIKDKVGRSQYIDLQYILPFNVIEGKSILPSNPIMTSIAALLFNKHPFFENEIYAENDSVTEKVKKQAAFLMSQASPSFAPFIGSSFDKIVNVIKQRPDKAGFVKDYWQVLLDVFGGIKITPIDPTLEAQKRAAEKERDIRDLRAQLKRVITDKSIFPEEKKKQKEKIEEKIKKTVEGN